MGVGERMSISRMAPTFIFTVGHLLQLVISQLCHCYPYGQILGSSCYYQLCQTNLSTLNAKVPSHDLSHAHGSVLCFTFPSPAVGPSQSSTVCQTHVCGNTAVSCFQHYVQCLKPSFHHVTFPEIPGKLYFCDALCFFLRNMVPYFHFQFFFFEFHSDQLRDELFSTSVCDFSLLTISCLSVLSVYQKIEITKC